MQFNLSTETGTVCTSQLIFLSLCYIQSIGQVQVIGNFQALLTNRILDPDITGLADLTTTLTVTATPEQNVTDCGAVSR